jgi:hypothetical protein
MMTVTPASHAAPQSASVAASGISTELFQSRSQALRALGEPVGASPRPQIAPLT